MRDFTIDGVIGRTFDLIRRHGGSFAIAAAILVALPNLVVKTAGVGTTRTYDAAGHLRDTTSSVSFLGGGGSLVAWLAGLVLYGIVVQAALGDLRGERIDLGTALGASLRAFLPNLAIWVLYYLAIILGLVLLIVPGLMLQCAWLVVVPASMAEGTGVIGAFGRSRALTSGHRWRIFGLLLLYGVAFAIVGLVAIAGAATAASGGAGPWAFRIVATVLTAAVSLVGSAGAAACYIALREVKEGSFAAEMVEAFA